MIESFQNEIPKARVNITLDIETNGALTRKELPLRLLVMGDYSHTQNNLPLAMRERISITKENFDQVMSGLNPRLQLTVANTLKKDDSELAVKLSFNQLKDFHPAQIVQQVPELSHLLAMRNLLKDLRANVLDNAVFCREMERIIQDSGKFAELNKQLAELTQTCD